MVLVAAWSKHVVLAQTTDAVCLPYFDWVGVVLIFQLFSCPNIEGLDVEFTASEPLCGSVEFISCVQWWM
jgi:hypothetical protein